MKKRWTIPGLALMLILVGVIVFVLFANKRQSITPNTNTTANHLNTPDKANTTDPNHIYTQIRQIQQDTTTNTTTKTRAIQPEHTNTQTTTIIPAATPSVAALLLGPDELPFEKCALFQLKQGGVPFGRFGREELQIEEKWLYLKDDDNKRKRALDIAFVVAANPDQAEQFAKSFKHTAVAITEITDERYLQLVDRAWGNDGRFVFVKSRIACEIALSREDGENADELYSIVNLAAGKIDALLAGKAMPAPLMPMSGAELPQVFQLDDDLVAMIWGKNARTLAILKDGIPRAVPAGKIGRTNDYQVPLRYIAALLDPKASVKIKGNTATVTLLGKNISMTVGEAAVTCDGKAVKIAAPVEIKSGQVLVPLSMFGATVDKPIAWKKEGARTIGSFSTFAEKPLVNSLLLNQNEIMYNDHKLDLFYLRFENKVRDYTVDNSLKIEEDWIGLSQKDDNKSRITINITFAIAGSLNEAIDEVNKARKNVAAIIPEIKDDKNISPYVDRSWGLFTKNGGRLIFIKGIYIVDIHIFDRGGVEPKVFYDISAKVLDKINKILAGKPVTISILPLSGEELYQDPLNSMTDTELGNAIWGKDAEMLIIEKIGIPRIVPAGKIGRNDNQVPLRYIAAIIDPQARVKIKGNTATVTLLGKNISMTAGEAAVTCDGKAVKIAAPVGIKSGHVLVPLSMFAATVDKKITWTKQGERTIGSF